MERWLSLCMYSRPRLLEEAVAFFYISLAVSVSVIKDVLLSRKFQWGEPD